MLKDFLKPVRLLEISPLRVMFKSASGSGIEKPSVALATKDSSSLKCQCDDLTRFILGWPQSRPRMLQHPSH